MHMYTKIDHIVNINRSGIILKTRELKNHVLFFTDRMVALWTEDGAQQ